MKTLVIDIETAPNISHTWGLYKQDVYIDQIVEPGRIICFAAKWVGEPKVMFYSEYHHGHKEMVEAAWRLLDEADVVVTYNGKTFDLPWLRTEFLLAGLTPPAPWKDVDLYETVKKVFRFPSNKLAYVTKALGLTGKLTHQGHPMWFAIMHGDEDERRKAWNMMRRYCKQDVVTTEEWFLKAKPYVRGLPNPTLIDMVDEQPDTCPDLDCQGQLNKRGFAYTSVSAYQRYVCTKCGRWWKGGKRIYGVDLREAK